ncbi:unnamed protein product [Paramecium sonneborni]|uniref:Uncharacterized protein n=1 Tax=Paramecium sonneborni TaxID=65129 RepID=A0A8S1QB33_9CILI|nr:unnamed protein product [Paramecium sonneborni]
MNFINSDPLILTKIANQQQEIKQYEIDVWNNLKGMLIKTKIQIIFKDHKIQYLKDGVILRIQQDSDNEQNPEILNNMEQIKYLVWFDQCELQQNKNSKLVAFWNGEIIQKVGGYRQNGQKQGLWKEIIQYYWDKAQVFEVGQYYNNQKIYKWNYIYKNNKIGGGQYNLQGQKCGKWIDLDEGFCGSEVSKLITYNGEYNKKGIKIGIWDIMFKVEYEQDFKQIGGGLYDHKEGLKIGRWVDLWEGFWSMAQIIYKGEYNVNGVKVGRWDIFFCIFDEKEFKQIGGGSYDNQQGLKIGRWVDLWESFWIMAKITYNGEYNMKGLKIGRWDIMYKAEHEMYFKLIGGGSHDSEQGQKIGKWVELWEGFCDFAKVTYSGEYNMKGAKIGRWDIMHCKSKEYELVGGGSFEAQEEETSIKIGKWVELWENFQNYAEITQHGQYDMKGKKVGRWDYQFKEYEDGWWINKQIGGGTYDSSFGIKIGMWIELWEGFSRFTQVTYNGEYNQLGMKVGRWNSWYKGEFQKQYKLIGGGLYEKGQKIGNWIELDDQLNFRELITHNGEYNVKSIKVGTWVEMKYDSDKKEFLKIKEKQYDN